MIEFTYRAHKVKQTKDKLVTVTKDKKSVFNIQMQKELNEKELCEMVELYLSLAGVNVTQEEQAIYNFSTEWDKIRFKLNPHTKGATNEQ